jgi:hypothetical protein
MQKRIITHENFETMTALSVVVSKNKVSCMCMPCGAFVVGLKVLVVSMWTKIEWSFLVFSEPGNTLWMKSA